jgi:2-polyprenyl-6-hydroxyphenyl methylase / 3-demethylubiquinone-9 3-methyltransferase
MFVATINRTLKSFAFAIVGAEYVLGWLPRGTHHWEKLITPEELERWLAAAGLKQVDITGVFYNPLTGAWARSRDADVNYMVVADKPKP